MPAVVFVTGGVPLPQRLPRIAVLGAGHVGPVIARVAIGAGYRVSIAASGDPADIELITQVLAPGAEPRSAADEAREADIVVLAIPLSSTGSWPPTRPASRPTSRASQAAHRQHGRAATGHWHCAPADTSAGRRHQHRQQNARSHAQTRAG
jgi:hypothetical protein